MRNFILWLMVFVSCLAISATASAHGLDANHAVTLGAAGVGALGYAIIGMAKVSMPLMSGQASGSFGGALVFGYRKGQNVVRSLVTPANPKSADQAAARNIVRCCGAAQRFARLEINLVSPRTLTDKALLTAAAPAGQTWNSYLVKCMTGTLAIDYEAATTLWGTLSANHAAWDTAAAALTPAIPAVAQKGALDAPATALTDGEVFFHYTYGLYKAGITTIPGAVPPVYA